MIGAHEPLNPKPSSESKEKAEKRTRKGAKTSDKQDFESEVLFRVLSFLGFRVLGF